MTEELQAMYRAVEARLGDAVICDRCGATLPGYADVCSAALGETCPGFERIDALMAELQAAP